MPATSLILILYYYKLINFVLISPQPKNDLNITLTAIYINKNLSQYIYNPKPESTASSILPRTIN